ncbi:uncharacterized protein PAC_09940 [Phialocephala subalpina]|uniref:gamma-glutamylcyclotransferase n=1 Tax=Phialocephala subalpina TaxID=576137 RepID=A0A1L7X4U9_9HELO|nr:uncharacterized protein PAC_09940 [Phialocephala subalpina]
MPAVTNDIMPTLESNQDSISEISSGASTPSSACLSIRPELTYGPPQPEAPLRFYFAYGSNLSLTQMSRRCPTATYHSFGILRNHTWKIGPRGYANVVPSSSSHSSSSSLQKSSAANKPVVYGALYTLQPSDEAALDYAEGVPFAYEKRDLYIEVLSMAPGNDRNGEGEGEVRVGQMVKALVYVDVKRTGLGIIKEEYVGRMNRSIRDARKMGCPEWYVRDVMRKGVPVEDIPDEEEMPE